MVEIVKQEVVNAVHYEAASIETTIFNMMPLTWKQIFNTIKKKDYLGWDLIKELDTDGFIC